MRRQQLRDEDNNSDRNHYNVENDNAKGRSASIKINNDIDDVNNDHGVNHEEKKRKKENRGREENLLRCTTALRRATTDAVFCLDPRSRKTS